MPLAGRWSRMRRGRGRQRQKSRSLEAIGIFDAAGVPGLEPRLTGPEPVGLPITPYPMGGAETKLYRTSTRADTRGMRPAVGPGP